MQQFINPFEQNTGSDRIISVRYLAFIGFLIVLSALITSTLGVVGGVMFIILPFIFAFLYLLFRFPIIGLYTAISFGFTLLGVGRYVTGIPIGLAMDGILILTFIALIFNKFYEGVDWTPTKKDITFLGIIWFGYSILEIFNPEARSFAAWFSSRSAFYMFLMIPLALLFIDSNRKLNVFFYIWGVFTLLVTLKGVMQLKLGVDPWEQAWLNEGNYKTHILFGKLRVFSFLSDAGQFGANQAYSAVVATIVSMSMTNWKSKFFFIIVALAGFYGMIISGTRGAISIPLGGFMAFFVLRKNIRVMVVGIFLLLTVFVFFKFTSIGQGNAQIRRMRTAFDPNDASLQVRLENQKRLKGYLASRPFGGGIGHGGVKAQKYLPNAFLSQIATDSGYVLVWVEQGIIGLILHLFILFYTVGKASFHVMFRIRDPILKMKIAALISGMFGIMVANYGNAVLQMPTGMLIYTSMALMLNSESLDTPKEETSTVNSIEPAEIKGA
jgi:hypothetical protein